MPVPKPLKRTASKKRKRKRMTQVMHDLKRGEHHGERTRAQEIAIGLKSAGMNRTAKRKSKRSGKKKTSRKVKRRSRR